MKTQILLVFFAACIAALMPAGVANAKAMECSVARPSSAHGYWSWRLIDGRKCWYAGKTMVSKSQLQWPAKASVQAKADTAQVKTDTAPVPVTVVPVTVVRERSDPLDAQARLLDYANSFEVRWRARAITD
ncbi:hypothetical protein [Bradyrhizobium sp. SRL28]|jgi:hypothetical protein|uniref:hypothetical protein n=1 Tax=Bradyrhizobium sp. SRL28 TaxID=2836178 RepID=UPI00201C82C4|nr:hypothetical protein [Bradyrhizobium sp. SRL28]